MSEKELNWLLQTIKDPATAERFVLAQYERGRISFQDGQTSPETRLDRAPHESIRDHDDW